ncbi:MAG TPA: Ig-like domain-containing protein [Polyangia bacterium]|nr:Ig-like domain-containing protein [Polyangia bacterium]
MVFGLLGAGGCSYPTATTPYPGLCPQMYVARWSPLGNAGDVPTDVTVEITFSDYPNPDTVGEPTMLLTTGVFRLPERYQVDLAQKTVHMKPGGPLGSNLGYTASVLPGVASLAGCTAPFDQREFTTGSGPANVPPPPVPALADVQAIFSASCAAGCHADPAGGCLPAPAGGLSLCAARARDALVDIPSREVADLALVTPLDSARSYLVRKILPATAGGGPIPGTLGQREPPGPPLPPDQLEIIVAWIDGGALP